MHFGKKKRRKLLLLNQIEVSESAEANKTFVKRSAIRPGWSLGYITKFKFDVNYLLWSFLSKIKLFQKINTIH